MIKKILLAAFCLSLPFTDAYVIHPYLPWPLLISLFLMFPYTVFFQQRNGRMLEPIDGWLLAGWIFGVVAIPMSPVFFGYNNVSHSLVLPVVLLGYLFIPLRLMDRFQDVRFFSQMFALMLLFYGVFIVLEYISRNYFGGFYFASIPHKSDLRFLVGNSWGGKEYIKEFYRPRGLAEEAGHSSLILEFGIPVMIFLASQKIIKRLYAYLICGLSMIAIFMLGSSIGILTAPLSLVLVAVVKRKFQLLFGVLLLGVVVVVVANFTFDGYFENTTNRMVGKATSMLTGEGTVGSGLERRQAYIHTFELFMSRPLGAGWGSVSIMSKIGYTKDSIYMYMGLLSLYSEWLVATGIGGAIVFTVYFAKIMKLAYRSGCYLLLAGLSALLLHYIIISNYWYPYLWVSVLFIRLFVRSSYGGMAPRSYLMRV